MVLSQDESKEQVKAELKEALDYFVERQQLVAQAMTDLGLDLNEVGEFGPVVWAWNPESNTHSSQKEIEREIANTADPRIRKMLQVALRASERELHQSGVWRDDENNEWHYFLHGSGCLLTNLQTGEPIDWDCPDMSRYDKWKFMIHLQWQLSSLERGEKLISANRLAQKTLKLLIDEITDGNLGA